MDTTTTNGHVADRRNVTTTNPVAALLRQAEELLSHTAGIPVIIDYEAITRAAIDEYRREEERRKKDPRWVITQHEAHQRYGQSVIRLLERRGLLGAYRFGLKEGYDGEGNLVREKQGVRYFRVAEIEEAIEKGNLLAGTKELRRKLI